MKHTKALRLKHGMTIVEVVISIVLIFIMVIVVTAVVGPVKERCVIGEHRLEVNKLAMYVIEKLLSLEYTTSPVNAHLTGSSSGPPRLHDNTTDPDFLPASGLSGYSISYTVADRFWNLAGGTGPYKEIVVTVWWRGMMQPTVFSVLRGQE